MPSQRTRQTVLDFASILAAPLGAPFLMPMRLMQSLWAMSVLLKAPLSDYGRTSPRRTLNCAWHRMYGLLIERYGRNGFALPIAMGVDLATQFHLTRLSAVAYWKAEAIVPWVSLLVSIPLVLTIPHPDFSVPVAAATILLFSTAFYYLAFEGLKHDALAWAIVPLGYWAIISGNGFALALVFLFVTFASITVSIVQGFVWFLFGLSLLGPVAIVPFLPGAIKLATHFLFLLRPSGRAQLRSVLSGIGMTEKGAEARKLRPRARHIHLIVLWFLFSLLVAGIADQTLIPAGAIILLCSLPPVLLLINTTWRRFADEQTLIAVAVFAYPIAVISLGEPVWLIGLWVVLTLSPRLVSFYVPRRQRSLVVPPIRRPYHLRPLADASESFLSSVPGHSRVIFHCAVSGSKHPDFDKYRALKEYLHFVLAERETGLVPDFYLQFQHMAGFLDIESTFGDQTPMERLRQLTDIGGTHVIVPQSTPGIDSAWDEAGFRLEAVLDCGDLEARSLLDRNCYNREKPFLLLLRGRRQPELCQGGVIVEMQANHITMKLDACGKAILKLFWSECFRTSGEASIKKAPGPFPWIQISGKGETLVELSFQR